MKIIVNGKVVEYNLLLNDKFKGINVDLVDGFNTIEFIALNGGCIPQYGPTLVSDEAGKVLHNNKWNLSTGSTASMVVVKEVVNP